MGEVTPRVYAEGGNRWRGPVFAMTMKLSGALFCASLLIIHAQAKVALPPADFYIGPAGNDANPGTAEKPFATIERARDAVRPLIAAGLDHDVTVLLFGGTYELVRPFALGPEDSGSERYSISYRACPGERVIITGGRQIHGWTKGPGAIWTAPLPENGGTPWIFHELFVGGVWRQRVRLPETGYYRTVGDIDTGQPAKVRVAASEVNAAWAARGDVEMVVLETWMDMRSDIRAVTTLPPPTSGTALAEVTLACNQPPYGHEKNARFWIENASGALTAPGQWYLDRAARTVSYRPLASEDPRTIRIVAPVLNDLVRIEGDFTAHRFVRNIRFTGLEFHCSDWSLPASGHLDSQAAFDIPGGISLQGASHCLFERCVVHHIGGYGISFGEGCKDNGVVRCEFSSLGAGAVKIGEPKIRHAPEEIASGNSVSESVIHDIGIIYPGAVAIWIGQSSGNLISHNSIYDTNYTAISAGWTWGYRESAAFGNIIEYNLIHDIGRGVLSDMGGIYTLGSQPGTLIRGNVIHDVTRHEYGGWGIYTDEGSSSILIRDNLVYRTQDSPVHQHYGKGNLFTNNIFALGGAGIVTHSRPDPVTGQFTMTGNILLADGTPLYLAGYATDAKKPAFASDTNLLWNTKGAIIAIEEQGKPLPLAQWQAMGLDAHSIVADPHFADPARGDFHLAPDSPAASIGFKPFEPSQAGPRAEQ